MAERPRSYACHAASDVVPVAPPASPVRPSSVHASWPKRAETPRRSRPTWMVPACRGSPSRLMSYSAARTATLSPRGMISPHTSLPAPACRAMRRAWRRFSGGPPRASRSRARCASTSCRSVHRDSASCSSSSACSGVTGEALRSRNGSTMYTEPLTAAALARWRGTTTASTTATSARASSSPGASHRRRALDQRPSGAAGASVSTSTAGTGTGAGAAGASTAGGAAWTTVAATGVRASAYSGSGSAGRGASRRRRASSSTAGSGSASISARISAACPAAWRMAAARSPPASSACMVRRAMRELNGSCRASCFHHSAAPRGSPSDSHATASCSSARAYTRARRSRSSSAQRSNSGASETEKPSRKGPPYAATARSGSSASSAARKSPRSLPSTAGSSESSSPALTNRSSPTPLRRMYSDSESRWRAASPGCSGHR
jgi:hypothetical protein